jgi:hypothetical protein
LQMLQRRLMAFSLARYEKLNSPTKNACVCVVPGLSFESENHVPPLCRTNKTLAVLYIICLHSTERVKKKSHHSYIFLLSIFAHNPFHFKSEIIFFFTRNIWRHLCTRAATFRVDRTLPSLSKLRNHEVSTLIET